MAAPLILLFDGECLLCDGLVQWLIRHDPHARLQFAALQSDTGSALLRRHQLPEGFLESVVAVDEAGAWLRSDAVLRCLRALGGPWRWLAIIGGLLPRFLREAAYRYVARHRYQWFGKHEGVACPLPSLAERARLLP